MAYLAGAAYRKTARAEMMGVTTVLNCSGVERSRFLDYTERNPATYRDWSRTWEQETTGKEDELRSPYLDMEFEEARNKVQYFETYSRSNCFYYTVKSSLTLNP